MDRDGADEDGFVPAAELAGIYRDLRKGLEDVKNEPGAADFYYSEMEMRRHANSKHVGATVTTRGASTHVERWLLFGYWAVSGRIRAESITPS